MRTICSRHSRVVEWRVVERGSRESRFKTQIETGPGFSQKQAIFKSRAKWFKNRQFVRFLFHMTQ